MSIYQCPRECAERCATCHIDCEKHQKFREENERNKKERKQEIAVKVYQCEQKVKSLKDKRNHKHWRRELKKK